MVNQFSNSTLLFAKKIFFYRSKRLDPAENFLLLWRPTVLRYFLKRAFQHSHHHTQRMTKTCMACRVQQRDCPSCHATSQSSGALAAHNYRESKKARIELTEADLNRTRIAYGMLLNELGKSSTDNKKLQESIITRLYRCLPREYWGQCSSLFSLSCPHFSCYSLSLCSWKDPCGRVDFFSFNYYTTKLPA